MEFLSKKEITHSKKFLQNGYVISRVEQKKSLNFEFIFEKI